MEKEMKSKHRHDLKTNELAEWLGNLPQWARENHRIIIYVSVVAVLVIGSASWYWYKKNVQSVREQLKFTSLLSQLQQSKIQVLMNQAKGADTSIMLMQVADNLESAAGSIKDDQMAALALIKHAEALRTALHYRQGSVSRVELDTTMGRAKAGYSEALVKALPNSSLMATAKFGLGLCEEELGNFEKAEQIYRELTTNPDFECTTAIVQAKQRLETMADYQQKIVFKPAPKPPEFIQPPFELGPVDANLAATDFVGSFLGDINPADILVSDTNLGDANLVDTNLGDTNPADTNLGDANLADTNLGDINQSEP
jgi:hypothetical protein